jgi:hypothetical protein
MATTTTSIYYDLEEEAGGMPVYPADDYESWISIEDADTYFESRLNSDAWSDLGYDTDKSIALRTAFRVLGMLPLTIDDLDTINAATLLRALGQAQCEQALHELKSDLDAQSATSVSIGGLLSVKMPEKRKWDRYSERAIAILRPWLSLPSIKRFR